MTILEQLAAHARERVRAAEAQRPLGEVRAEAMAIAAAERERTVPVIKGAERVREAPEGNAGGPGSAGCTDITDVTGCMAFPFEAALRAPGMRFICECKKASPSKGLISPDFPYLRIAREYEAAGAAAISCLTEPRWFLGEDRYLREIAAAVSVPVLRKDFTVSAYQIYEAKCLGAAAVLLICALLPEETLREYIAAADSVGLSALVEAHDEAEIDAAVSAGARVIGVNNRNLHDFSVDIRNGLRLRSRAPRDVLFVAESGIRTREDIAALEEGHVDAVLVGEALMRAEDKGAMLRELSGRPG